MQRIVPVGSLNHDGNQNSSPEEVERLGAIVDELLQPGVNWINDKGQSRPLRLDDILIVAPYNAQVSDLLNRLTECESRHSRQVSGSGSASSDLFANDFITGGGAARNGISLQSEPAECGNISC